MKDVGGDQGAQALGCLRHRCSVPLLNKPLSLSLSLLEVRRRFLVGRRVGFLENTAMQHRRGGGG